MAVNVRMKPKEGKCSPIPRKGNEFWFLECIREGNFSKMRREKFHMLICNSGDFIAVLIFYRRCGPILPVLKLNPRLIQISPYVELEAN